jgi:hypothetical protein
MSTGDESRTVAPDRPAAPPAAALAAPAAQGPSSAANAATLARELDWLDTVLSVRTRLHFNPADEFASVSAIAPPELTDAATPYARLVAENALGWTERIVIALALAPHLRPTLLDPLFLRNQNIDRGFTEFGGWKGRAHGGFLPTCETAAFIVAGDDLDQRLALTRLLAPDQPLRQRGILRVEHDAPGEPFLSAPLLVASEYLAWLTTGERHKPDFSSSFPAKLITTPLGWGDLVLADEVLEDIAAITTWNQHSATLLRDWQLAKAIKPGYRALFFGPPGTGKTLTATLIGQASGADVYRIDLSMVVSKYIGETEKNLAQVFDQAQNRHWILFFDEADALFGKRTATSSSNDRHANQEVSYLLQRVEDFPGTVILATNLKANIDDAFARRFQAMIHFPMPDADQRLRLWEGMVRHTRRLAADVDLPRIAEAHELSGGAIANVVRYGAIRALQMNRTLIGAADLQQGIVKELRKEGRTA